MGAVMVRVRAELRARRRALLALALLVSLFGGVVLASVAGARRTASAYARMLDHLGTSDVSIGQDSQLRPAVLERLAALPQVDAAGQAAFMLLAPNGIEQFGVSAVAPADELWLRILDRVHLLEGRMPERIDEVLLTPALARRTDARVGDMLTFSSFAPAQIAELFAGEAFEPKGADYRARLVGIGLHPHHLSTGSAEALDAVFSHEFYREHADDVLHFGPSLMVRLRGGLAALPDFRREVAALEASIDGPVHVGIGSIAEDNDIRVISNHDLYRSAREAVQIQGIAMWLFAGLLGLTATLLLGQALARQSMIAGTDAPWLRALGMSRGQVVVSAVMPAVLAAAMGLVIGAALAVAASGVFPTGFARTAEPTPGPAADLVALGAGAAAMAFALAAGAVLGVSRTARAARQREGAARARPSALASAVSRAGGSAASVVGVRMALEPGRGRTAVPVRTAFVGGVAGIAALVGALGVGASLDRFVATPSAYGINWDAAVSGGDDPATMPKTIERLRATQGVDAFSAFVLADVRAGGGVLQAYFVDRIEGDVAPSMAEGRAPRAPQEVALGTATMRRLDVALGESIEVEGRRTATFTVVGRAVFPAIDEDTLDDGAVFDVSADEVLKPIIDYPVFPVRFTAGADHAQVMAALTEEFGGTDTFGTDRPGEVENLARVAGVPRALALILVVLAMATNAHASVTTVRRRARDLAVLKSMGFDRRQVTGAIRAQGATFAVVAAALGVPAGIIAGRWAWVTLSGRLGVDAAPDPALLLSVVALPAALVAVVVTVSSVPARTAARTEPASVLRSE